MDTCIIFPSSSGEGGEDGEMEIEQSVEVDLHPQQYTEQHHKLPSSGLSAKWYERQSELAVKNVVKENDGMRVLYIQMRRATCYRSTRVCFREHSGENIKSLKIKTDALADGNIFLHLLL